MTALRRIFAAGFIAYGLMQTASAQVVIPPGAEVDLAGAELDISCESVEIGGTYSLSGGSLIGTGALNIQPGGALHAQGNLEIGGNFDNQGILDANGGSITINGACVAPGSSIKISGTANFANLNLVSTSGQTFEFQAGAAITVTGNLVVQGDPTNPVVLTSATDQPINIQLAPGTQVSQTYVQPNNVTIGAITEPPITAAPTAVPVLSEVLIWMLSLLILALSYRQLRNHRSPFASRR